MKINRLLPSLALAAALAAVSCGKLEDRINSLEQRIAELEDTKIPTIDEQVASINRTIGDMDKTDAALKEYISALQEKSTALESEIAKTNKALEEVQAALREEIASDKAELSEEIGTAKAEVIAQLEAFKSLMEGELGTLNSTISELKAKDEELRQKTEELRSYVDSENGKVRDWADATFATIGQQNALSETVAGIKAQFESLNTYTQTLDVRLTNRTEELSKSILSLDESTKQQINALTEKISGDVSALRTELTDAYTKLVAAEITRLETSMKSWVNDRLAGYYTVEQTDAKLEAMKSELDGRIDTEKAYLVTLITNLETTTNKKIAANSSLITGLRGDLTSLQQSVAENAGKIADDAILIGQNAEAVAKNGSAIAANTKDLATVKSLAEQNKGLIAENSAKIGEMQELLKTLKDSGIDDYAATILKNTEDIAANATLIAKNSENIRSNAEAIAQNASDIAALQKKLDGTKAELVESYTAAIAKAISDYDGTITGKLATDIAAVEEKVKAYGTDISALSSRIAALENKVAGLEEIVSHIASISYIPRYADGAERVEYTRDALEIIPGAVTLRFDVHPAGAAAEIAAGWKQLLSARAVYTLTKAGAGDFVELTVTGAAAENGVLSVTVATDALNKDFIIENLSVSAVVKITSDSKNIVSDYVKLIPSHTEEKDFVYYLLNNFDTDGDGILNADAVEAATEFKVSGMHISTLDGVLDKMPNLEILDCSKNSLSSLNLTVNTHLTQLDCSSNQLQSIDVSKNTMVKSLDCNSNKLLYLDLSNNNLLNFVNFQSNENLLGIIHGGLEIDGLKWQILNYGTTSTAEYVSWTRNGYNAVGFTYKEAADRCPSGWRLPTREELKSLSMNYSGWTSINGVSGRWFSGKTEYSKDASRIFLPAVKKGNGTGSQTYYYSQTRYDSWDERTYCLFYIYDKSVKENLPDTSSSNEGLFRCVKE